MTRHPSSRPRGRRGVRIATLASLSLVAAACAKPQVPTRPLDVSAVLAQVRTERSACPSGTLALDDAVALMRRNNPEIRKARADAEAAQRFAATPTPYPNPSIGIGPPPPGRRQCPGRHDAGRRGGSGLDRVAHRHAGPHERRESRARRRGLHGGRRDGARAVPCAARRLRQGAPPGGSAPCSRGSRRSGAEVHRAGPGRRRGRRGHRARRPPARARGRGDPGGVPRDGTGSGPRPWPARCTHRLDRLLLPQLAARHRVGTIARRDSPARRPATDRDPAPSAPGGAAGRVCSRREGTAPGGGEEVPASGHGARVRVRGFTRQQARTPAGIEIPIFDRNQPGIAEACARRDALREQFAPR